MGFKKTSNKVKKKAKSKKTNKLNKAASAREWDYEGGQVLEEYPSAPEVHDENPDGTGSRQRRQTQDRDERLRRGRRTLEDRAKKRSNTKKMSKKISFKRIATEDVSDDDCDSNHLKHNKKQRMEPPVSTNPLPIADRLQLMVARTRKAERDVSEDDDEESLDDYVISDEEMLEDDEEVIDENDLEELEGEDSDEEEEDEKEEEEEDEDHIVDGGQDEDEEAAEMDHMEEDNEEDESTNTQADSRIFNWFFNNYLEGENDLILKTKGDEVSKEQKEITSKLRLLESNLCLSSSGYDTNDDTMNDKKKEEEDGSGLESNSLVGSMYGSLLVPRALLCAPAKESPSSVETVTPGKQRRSTRGKKGSIDHENKNVADANTEILLGQRLKTMGDLPCLHKMYKKQASCPIPGGKLSQNMLGYLMTYADLLLEGRDHTNDDAMLSSVMMHVTNHLLFSRSKVSRNNHKMKHNMMTFTSQEEKNSGHRGGKRNTRTNVTDKKHTQPQHLDTSQLPDEAIPVPDQGYTRARILILCPFRNSAYEIVKSLQTILGTDRTTTSSLEKFLIEFGPQPEHSENAHIDQKKPKDWQQIFQQNVDDDFKIGIQVNPGQGKGNGASRGSNIRLYSDFFQSDIILASPLGMRLIMEKATDNESSAVRITSDFLSSLEIIYVHQADVLFMQNWSHVEFVLKHCNQLPLTDHDVDFTRIRPYFFEKDESAKHRQLITTTNFNDPQIQAVYRQYAHSKAGQLRLRKHWEHGCIEKVSSKVKQIFYLIPTTSKDSEDDERHAYFLESILSQVIRLKQKRTLIITPSYLNYVRVRNELIKRDVNAAFVCEYSRESEISRGRSQFFHGVKDVLLYSGRAHFFRRFLLRGACHLIFYSLPEYAHFYHEIVNTLGEGESLGTVTSCLVLSTKFEKMALERLVGVKQCAHMLQAHVKLGKTTFMFC